MPKTKNSSTPKSRTNSKLAKKKFHFQWWMAALLVLVIALVGILVLRFSRASGGIGVLYPNMPNQVVCGVDPAKKSLHVCRGEVVNNTDGVAWRTNAYDLTGTAWYGPYENLTLQPGGEAKYVKACVTTREVVAPQFGIGRARYVFDITTDFGTKTLASVVVNEQQIPQNSPGASQVQTIKTSANGVTITCLTANIPETTAKLNNVEYRIRMQAGSVDIYQMVRSFSSNITSDANLPTSKPSPDSWRWPVDTNAAQVRGIGSPGGDGCFGAARNGGRTHRGVDLTSNNSNQVPIIDVYAARAGTVSSTGNDPGGFGPYIIIKHADNLYTLYGHLSAVYVGAGQQVTNGQLIGKTGEGGNAAGTVNQVHFQIQTVADVGVAGGTVLNPFSVISQPINHNGCNL